MASDLGLAHIRGACVLCALQYVSKHEEEHVMKICLQNKWAAKRGMQTTEWLKAAKQLGIMLEKTPLTPIRVGRFLKKFTTETYLVETSDHLFVIENGIMIDPREPKPPGLCRTILSAYRITHEEDTAYDTIA